MQIVIKPLSLAEKAERLLLSEGDYKTTAIQGSNPGGKMTIIMGDVCPACYNVHPEELFVREDDNYYYYVICPLTEAHVHLIYS
jgi:hypothetical protein